MNREIYDNFVKDFGEPEKGSNEYGRFEFLMPIEPPECFAWLFGEFIKLYNASDTEITPEAVESYQRLNQFRFSLYEVELLFRMKGWGSDERVKLDRGDDDA